MKENEIIQKVVSRLSDIENAEVIAVNDFTEKRCDNQIVVGITSITQLNNGTGCPDYKYAMEILLDSSIAEDNSANTFNELVTEIKMKLLPFELAENALPLLFGDIPVVFLGFENENFSVSERSNQCTLHYTIIASW